MTNNYVTPLSVLILPQLVPSHHNDHADFFRPNYRPVFNLFMTYELRRTDGRCDEHRTVARRILKIKLDYRVANSDGLLPPISRFLGHSAMMSASFTGSLHSSPLALCGSPNMSTFGSFSGFYRLVIVTVCDFTLVTMRYPESGMTGVKKDPQ